jgi:hypothetical protein
MNTITRTSIPSMPWQDPSQAAEKVTKADDKELRGRFDQFVGETFFGQMLKTMRQSLGKPAYFHGGRGEEVFQAQLDQTMVEKISEASADTFTNPMFELFNLQRS